MKLKHKFYLTGCILIASFFGCKKNVTVPVPATSLVGEAVYTSNTTAIAAVTGIFDQAASSPSFWGSGFDATPTCGLMLGLSADELHLDPNANFNLIQAYTNSLKSNSDPFPFWQTLYNTVYNANASIAGLSSSSGVTPSVKQRLIGEAKFARAFCYFYLVNIFGDVPLITTPNYLTNSSASRTPKAQVYQQIITDLKDAQNSLSDSYFSPAGTNSSERTLPNQGAATALLARVYLYTGDYKDAASEATSVISDANYSLLSDLNGVFLKNSNEAIWQLQPVQAGFNTVEGATYESVLDYGIIPSLFPVSLSTQIVSSFENGDFRKLKWVDSTTISGTSYYVAYKYKIGFNGYGSPVTEYEMVLRLAEQYLIRAEAEANGAGGGANAAVTDLNVIRNRAGLANYAGATDQASLMAAILHERQVELFTEWGHRWLDLKRTNKLNSVMGSPGNVCAAKGGSWSSNAQLYPLPVGDIQTDHNLTQNPGY